VIIILITEKAKQYAERIMARLILEGFNAELDDSDLTLSKKIR